MTRLAITIGPGGNHHGRPDRRVLINGRWVRKDPMADNVYAWLKTGQQLAAVNLARSL